MAGHIKKLNEQHMLFIEYLIQCNGNGTEAALRAGYSKSNARVRGSELKADPLIIAEYNARKNEVLEATKISTEDVVNEIREAAFANIGDFAEWKGGRYIDNPHYLTPDQHKERDVMRQTQEALGHTLEPIDPLIDTKSKQIWQHPYLSLIDSDKLSRAQKSAIGEIIYKPGQFGPTVGFKLSGKLDALGKLANILGLNQPKKIEVSTNLETTNFNVKKRAADD